MPCLEVVLHQLKTFQNKITKMTDFINNCAKLVGKQFEFDQDTHGTFHVKQSWIDMLQYYEPNEL